MYGMGQQAELDPSKWIATWKRDYVIDQVPNRVMYRFGSSAPPDYCTNKVQATRLLWWIPKSTVQRARQIPQDKMGALLLIITPF